MAGTKMKTAIAFVVLSLASLRASAQDSGCLMYEPHVVQLTGIVVRKDLPGPPYYTDATPERVWLLVLTHPICVNEIKGESFYPAAANIHQLQIGFAEDNGYKKYRNMVGKRVLVSGTLFYAQTGHHHTEVLLTAKTIEKVPGDQLDKAVVHTGNRHRIALRSDKRVGNRNAPNLLPILKVFTVKNVALTFDRRSNN